MIYGTVKYNEKIVPQIELEIILVQQNSNPWEESSDSDSILRSQKLTQTEIDSHHRPGNPRHHQRTYPQGDEGQSGGDYCEGVRTHPPAPPSMEGSR